jgi:signal recognition particle subunit SEC65
MQRYSIISFLILMLIISNNDYVEGQPYKHGDRIKGLMSQLDQNQRSELKNKLKSLRKSGASPGAISQAIREQYTTAGIELPENFSERINRHEQNWIDRKSQREDARRLVKEMKAQGATRKEIRNALKEAGIEKPRGKRRGPMSQLNIDQRKELKQKLKSLRKSGASPETISQAIRQQYTTAGIELPESFSERISKREQNWVKRDNQREEARRLIKEMRAQGATRKEIRNVLKEAGIEKPRGKRRGGRHQPAHEKQPDFILEKNTFRGNPNQSNFVTVPNLGSNGGTNGIGTAVEADSWGRLKARMTE